MGYLLCIVLLTCMVVSLRSICRLQDEEIRVEVDAIEVEEPES